MKSFIASHKKSRMVEQNQNRGFMRAFKTWHVGHDLCFSTKSSVALHNKRS